MDRALEFMQQYRAAFVRGDVDELLGFYEFPLQLVDVGNQPASVSVVDALGWRATLGRLVHAYRRLAVSDASTGTFEVTEPLPGVAAVRAQWVLRGAEGSLLYDFAAAYGLVEFVHGLRIVSIVHDEVPRLRAALGTR